MAKQSQPKFILTPRSFVQKLSLFHTLFFVSIVGFAVFAYFTTENSRIDLENTEDPFFILVPIVVFAGLILGKFLFSKLISQLSNKKSLQDKLAGYQTGALIYYVCFEGPALFSIIAFIMTANLYFLIIAVVIAAYFFLQRPTHNKVATDLSLSGKFKSKFDDLEEPIS